MPLQVPCGQCIGCRLERSRQWAVRCVHEAQLHSENCFLTLTYEVDPWTLVPRDLTLFLKKLRRFADGERISYFACGEYGERYERPHFHVLVFGLDFPDKRPRYAGSDLFTSKTLDRIWGHGQAMIGAVTFESAAYVARYVTKKVTGEAAGAHYAGREPEFVRMSTRPPIGSRWYRKFGSEVAQGDSVVMRGREMKPPRFYDRLREQVDPRGMARARRARARAARSPRALAEASPWRLHTREVVKKASLAVRKGTL